MERMEDSVKKDKTALWKYRNSWKYRLSKDYCKRCKRNLKKKLKTLTFKNLLNSVYKFRLQTGKEQKMMKQGRLGYNSSNGRYGLLASDLWIDTGFHCGEGLEVLVDDEWVQTRMEMNLAREWYLVGTPYCGDLEYVQARIPE